MIDRKNHVPVTRQCQLLKLSRTSLYYRPRPVSEDDLRLMRRLDELHLEFPFAGARMLRDLLSQEALKVGRRRGRQTDASPGHTGPVPAPEHHKTGWEARDLPLSAAGSKDRAAQSSLGGGHHLHSDEPGIYLSFRGDGLVESEGIGLATVEHAVHGFLSGGRKPGHRSLRLSGDLQHGPGLSVHEFGICCVAYGTQHKDQHGRQGLLAGQRFRRTALADSKVRGGLPAGLRGRGRS